MFHQLLVRLQEALLGRPRAVVVATGLLAVIAVGLGLQVEFRTSRAELAPAGDPDQVRWEQILEEYKGSEALIVCVEAVDPDRTPAEHRRFVDALARSMGSDPAVDHVFHRFDVGWFVDRWPHFVDAAAFEIVTSVAESERELLEVFGSGNLARLNDAIASRISSGLARGMEADPRRARLVVDALVELLQRQRRFFESPEAVSDAWAAISLESLFADGYAATDDGSVLFALVIPRDVDDSLPARRGLIRNMRDKIDGISREFPGFAVGFTGTAAMSVEEMDTVRRDTWVTSAVAVFGVGLLTFFVFRWRSHAVLVLLALALGVLWSFGAVYIELGYLNLITSAFVSTLVGVGVAYGIHPVSEYEIAGAHTEDPRRTVAQAYRRTGAAVSTAGLTTSVAFFSILLMRFRGFAELGLVAGIGVLLCLLAAMVSLPAFLLLYGRWRHARDRKSRGERAGIDRWWVETVTDGICRFPRATVTVALILTATCAWSATGMRFNTNILDLLPRDAESLRYQRKMILESDLSPVFNLVVAEDAADLARMEERALRESSIERFESALKFLPSGDPASTERIEVLRRLIAGIVLPEEFVPGDREALLESLRDLEESLDLAAEAAFTAGAADLAGPLERAREAAASSAAIVASADEVAVREWTAAMGVLADRGGEHVERLRAATDSAAPTAESLPPELRRRFFTATGRPLGLLYPVGSVFDPDELSEYVAASLRVSPDAIGFPFMFHKMSRRITAGFYRAVVAGAVLVLLILMLDLRSPRHALYAMFPLAIGLIWTLGLMRWLGFSFNFANLVAVPLIIGVGIDNGVHVVHRVRLEGRKGMRIVLRHTGRAILIASMTTMIGFGSLALASHRGLASLGTMLLLGVGSCFLASTIVLPNLLVVLGRVER